MKQLNGKYALITGASQGLGRQLALAFAREGAAGIVIVARDAAALEAVRHEVESMAGGTVAVAAQVHNSDDVDRAINEIRYQLKQAIQGPKVVAIAADLNQPADIERVIATTLAAFEGQLDVLINNASAIGPSPMPYLLDYPVEDFQQVINTNLVAPFLLIKKALPALLESRGAIINVTSDAGVTGYPGWGAYGISKFGIEGLSQTWAAELEGSGVRVNWVDPGDMNTAMHRAAEPDVDPTQWADPATVTDVFIYLASDQSKATNGQRFQAQESHWGVGALRSVA
ncbi:SDR family NAD(P)-dependent oxidoreductase [cf. Phormidesmis sp. LEGE 11477]|uniref:SDR family NAD(P)-dependent oxidoreductase n=1 Tax=cf. Phormidesmis sp. LEGE 11477 TaxID=1828680 RepID=UPI00187E39D2|nr:SDR family oxidoreductase [cf. Phormidesmis sp. LEGE 11477]MBE9064362.1 SDR family oxidoreductase [cf. Phormidesmis sp. LEGE 11477]